MEETRHESWLPPRVSARGPGEPQAGAGGSTDEPAAPSIAPNTEIDHRPPQERLAGRDHSTEDAMGLDKRRQVTGGTYGPTRTRVIMRFVVFFAVVGAIFVGLLFLVDQLDQPPDSTADKAPWSAEGAPQREPEPIQ